MKKIITLVFLVFYSAVLTAEWRGVRNYLEIYGEYNFFNKPPVYAINADNSEEKQVSTFTPSFTAVYLFNSGDDLYALYLKKDTIIAENSNINESFTNTGPAGGKYKITGEEQWGVHYVGIGLRKYFFSGDFYPGQVLINAGIDGGLFFTVNNISEFRFPDISGENKEIAIRYQSVFPGLHADIGAEYWAINEVGLFTRGGFRLCSGKMSKEEYVDASLNGITINVNDSLNHTGFYIQAGVLFKFQEF